MVEERTVEVPDRPHLRERLRWYRRRGESQAAVDELTGLRTQRALWRELSRRAQSCSPSQPLAVLMLDFDLLDEINQVYGEGVGDAVLKRAASVTRAAAASPRLVFRYGGEEFVLLAETHNGAARQLAERVRADIAAQNGSIPGITVSVGVAELDGPVEPWVALDRADSALRDAKRSGGNRVAVAGRTSPGERVVLVEELERETARRAALALAVATLEVRDSGTAEHSDDVLTLCEAVGRRLGLDEPSLQRLLAGAQLHDVGKVAVPSGILNKPGALNEAEWEVIRQHTLIGERILRSVPEMAEVATIVRHSHERWDGGGYPDGLAGERIPLESRVILCADAFHAMRSDRPYRRGRPAAQAIAELKACSGTQFDPGVVDAFLEVTNETCKGTPVILGPRRRRLVALLTALVIGGGSAVAAIPEVRDAMRSVFGAAPSPTENVVPATPSQGFEFGPLGDLLTLQPAAHQSEKAGGGRKARNEDKTSNSTAGASERRREGSLRSERGAGISAPGGIPAQPRGSKLHGTKTPTPTGTPPTGGVPQSGGTAPGTGGTPKPTNGNGQALGQGLPTPRRSAQPPPHKGGRTDPPALGHTKFSQPHGNGNGLANGHTK